MNKDRYVVECLGCKQPFGRDTPEQPLAEHRKLGESRDRPPCPGSGKPGWLAVTIVGQARTIRGSASAV